MRVKYNVFVSQNETLAHLLLTSFSYVQENIFALSQSNILLHLNREEKKKGRDFPFFSFSKLSSTYFMAKEEMFLLRTLKKKSTENPVGSWSQGGPLLSCYGSVNGEATLNALMEPR